MDYAEAREAFFRPRAGASATLPDDTRDNAGLRLRHVLEPIATVHYWSEPANRRYADVGLDFLTGYVWSRGCVLGEPAGAVVASAFGVFEPGMIASIYGAARRAATRPTVLGARTEGAAEALEQVLGGTAGAAQLETVVGALRRAVLAGDTTGRPLFAGAAALLDATDDAGVIGLWLAANALREYRGDSHLAACVAVGLSGLEANLLTEMRVGWEPRTYTATRGWSPEAMDAAVAELAERKLVAGDALTDEGRALRERVEETTERAMAPLLTAVGDDLTDVVELCDRCSQSIVERGWFPPDPLKRDAG